MFLEKIARSTTLSLPDRKKALPLTELKRRLKTVPPPLDFEAALKAVDFGLIAEIKRASPSKGELNPHLDAPALARLYASGGAVAISILTEPQFFQGSFADLSAVRKAVSLPLLCKDFIVDSYQVYEARAYSADALLLIVALLPPKKLKSLLDLTHSLGMSALVEVHTAKEVEKALSAGARVIGINNRNLRDFSVNLKTTPELMPLIPAKITIVSESGIHSPEDALLLRRAGVRAILVGEELVTSPHPAARIKELLGK